MSVAEHRAADADQEQPAVAVRGVGESPDLAEGWAPTPAGARGLHRAVASPAGVLALQRAAGNRATSAAVRRRPAPRRMMQRLGYPLGVALPKSAEKPEFGDLGNQRRYSVEQFERIWAAQFHAMSPDEKANVDRGCIGITVTNLGLASSSDPPLGEVYGRFDEARSIVAQRNAGAGPIDLSKPIHVWVMFAMLFWSNRDPDEDKRIKPNPKAFRPDPVSGRVDMSPIFGNLGDARPGYTNFDFGFWDEQTQCFWHANHGKYRGMKTPEEVYQSTRAKFANKYWENGEEHVTYPDFDRVVYGVTQTTVLPEKIIVSAPAPVYSRQDQIAAFKAQVSRSQWPDAVQRLNGFDDADIKRLARGLTHDERAALASAAPGAMPGYSDRVTDALALVDAEPAPRPAQLSALDASIAKGDWPDVALRLNGLDDADIKRRLGKMTKAQRAAIAAAAPAAMPGWSDRVVNAVAAIDAPARH
ncbi:MAG TPA: hypothetical protein VGF68_02960 [Solirubrobacteraceae bacterium]